MLRMMSYRPNAGTCSSSRCPFALMSNRSQIFARPPSGIIVKFPDTFGTKKVARQAVEEKDISTRGVKSSTSDFMTLLLDNDEPVWAARLLVARAFFLGDTTMRKQSAEYFDQYPELEGLFGGRAAWVDDPSQEYGPLVEKSVLPDYDAILSGKGDASENDGEEGASSLAAFGSLNAAGDTPVSEIQTSSGEANDVGCGRLFNEGSVLQTLVERIQLAGSAAEAEEAISRVTKEFGPIQEKWRCPTPFALLLPRI